MFLIIALLFLSGCVVEQKQSMGANDNLNEGFSGFGTLRMKSMTGPIPNMMIRDEHIKSRTSVAKQIADGESFEKKNVNLGLPTRKDGTNVYSGRFGLVNDKKTLTNEPYLKKKQRAVDESNLSLEEKIKVRLENLQSIHRVYVVTDEPYILIGIESSEQDRNVLRRNVMNEVKKITNSEHVRVAFDKRNIKRIQKLKRQKQS